MYAIQIPLMGIWQADAPEHCIRSGPKPFELGQDFSTENKV